MTTRLPAWIADLGTRGGPLLTACAPCVDESFPRGTEGLRELGSRIDAFAYRDGVTEDHERQFIEQTGALLALILLEHLGDGAYVTREGMHRMRLNKRGFFDPFAVVDAALDAEKPKRFLADAVAALEAEARDEGPVSRVLLAFERKLSDVRPDLQVTDRFECTLWLSDGTEIDLRRAVDATRDESHGAVEQATQKLIDMLPGGPDSLGISCEDARARLLPRVVPRGFDAQASGLLLTPIVADVELALILAYEGRARYVRESEPPQWGMDGARLQRIALENLAEKSARARFGRVDTPEGACIIARTGDGLDAARLVLPTLYDVLRAELGDDIFVAAPHRDTLHACASTNPTLVAAFRARVESEAARAPHRISASLFRLSTDGLTAER